MDVPYGYSRSFSIIYDNHCSNVFMLNHFWLSPPESLGSLGSIPGRDPLPTSTNILRDVSVSFNERLNTNFNGMFYLK